MTFQHLAGEMTVSETYQPKAKHRSICKLLAISYRIGYHESFNECEPAIIGTFSASALSYQASYGRQEGGDRLKGSDNQRLLRCRR